MIFTRQFATLLGAKVPLSDSLKSLYRQTNNVILREVVYDLYSDIDSGLSFSQSLERQKTIFSEFYINMIKSAEVTGRVEEVMGFLADYLEKEAHLMSKVRNALIYPITVIIVFIGVAILLLTVVLPQIQPIFEESNIELPLFTKILLGIGSFLANWWLAVIFGVVILIMIFMNYLRTSEGQAVSDDFLVRLPVLGNLFRRLYVARFAESFSVLIKGGVPVVQSIEVAGHTIDNILYREALHEVAEDVKKGDLLSRALEKQEAYFPPLVSQMVAVGETTGKLDELLGRIASFYSRQVEDIVGNLVELIQPILILGIGVLAGLLFASILIPLYSLVETF
jgi:type IV pilus assembly protein PilC